jgi:hypothetical protein
LDRIEDAVFGGGLGGGGRHQGLGMVVEEAIQGGGGRRRGRWMALRGSGGGGPAMVSEVAWGSETDATVMAGWVAALKSDQ